MALSKLIGDVIAEELECSICHDILKSPRMLTCLHSFCEYCLEGRAENLDGFLHCPTCRERTFIPNVGITGLKPDFRANKLLEALNKNRTSKQGATMQQSCSLCKSSKASLFCEECDLKMCQGCAEFHLKMPICRNHQTVPLTELSSEIVPHQLRDLAKLVTQVDEKAKDLDSFLSKIVATKQVLDRKSSDIAQEIEIEVAKIKALLLEKSKNYIEKNRDDIIDIEQRNRSAKEAIEEVARVLHQVSSSKDDLEMAEMHHSLLESVRHRIESDAITLGNLRTKFKTLTMSRAQAVNFGSLSPIKLVEKIRVLEQHNVPHATRYCAVGKEDDGTVSVVYATSSGQMYCHHVQKHSMPGFRFGVPMGAFGSCSGCQKSRPATIGATAISSEVGRRRFTFSGRTCSCPYDILPNGQICCIEGDELFKGSASFTLHALRILHQNKDCRHNDKIYQGHSMAVSTKGYVYVATAGLDYLLEMAPNNIVLASKPIGSIIPLAISTCNTSPWETLLIASKPASVSLIDSQQNIRRIFSDREGVVWENAALTCSDEGLVYLLSSQDSKITLQVLDKEGNHNETIFRDRPLSSQNPPLPEETTIKSFSFGSAAREVFQYGITHVLPSSYKPKPEAAPTHRPPASQSTSPTSPATQQRLAPRLSIAVSSNGDIVAVLDENELVLITLKEIDVYRV